MTSQQALLDRDSIVVGRPLAFSVYSADRKLLLAKGRVVESERARDQLIRAGCFQSSSSALELAAADDTRQQAPLVEGPLEAFVREYHSASGGARVGIRLSRDETGESFPCWILGADEQHGLIVTAPATNERSFVAVSEGQTWIFRAMYLTAAVKFHGTIRKVQFEPVPLLNVSLPQQLEMRHVRASPRVNACLRGHIEVGKEIPILITDISTGGVRIAVERAQCDLSAGQRLLINFTLALLGRDYVFKVPATVISKRPEFERRYPNLWVAGLMIETQSELEKLVLHSYVFEHVALEFNPLWRLLAPT